MNDLGLIEMLGMFGIVLGLALWQIWVLKRDERRARRASLDDRARHPEG